MPTTDELIIKITGDTGKFKDTSDKVVGGLNRMATGVQDFGIKFGLMMNGLKMATGYMNDLLGAYHKQEVAEAKLTAAMKNVKTASADATDELIKQAQALQKLTTYGDEEIINAQAMLATFQLNEEQIKAITPRLLDMAAASQAAGKADADLQSIAIALGKGFTGQIGILGRYGVVLDKARIETEGFAGIIKSLDDNYKGMAETVAATSAGALTQFQNQMGDMKEDVGELMSDYLMPFLKLFKSMLDAFDSTPPIVKRVIISLGLLGIAFVAFIRVLNLTMTTAGTLTGVLVALGAAITVTNILLERMGEKIEENLKTEWIERNNEQIEIWADKLNKVATEMYAMEDKGSPAFKRLEKRAEILSDKIKWLKNESETYAKDTVPSMADAIKDLIPTTDDATDATEQMSEAVKELQEEIIALRESFLGTEEEQKIRRLNEELEQERQIIDILNGEYVDLATSAVEGMRRASEAVEGLSSSMSDLVVDIGKPAKQFLISGKEIEGMVRKVGIFIDNTFSRVATTLVDKMFGVKIRWQDIFQDILRSFIHMVTQMIARLAALAVFNWMTGGTLGFFGSLFSLKEGGAIKKAQQGLIVRQPTIVMAGEGGEWEAVIPISKLFNVLRAVTPPINISTSDPNIAVDYYGNWPRAVQDRFVREIVQPAIERELMR